MKTIHFTSCGYTTIKTASGSYSFRGVTPAELAARRDELAAQVARCQRQIDALDALSSGQAVRHPDALR